MTSSKRRRRPLEVTSSQRDFAFQRAVPPVLRLDAGVEKPCLVTGYEFAEGIPSAVEALRDQPAIVVAHDLLPGSTLAGHGEFPGPNRKPTVGAIRKL